MKKFLWPRYWHPLNSTIYCGKDGEGFFIDPASSDFSIYNQDCQVIEDIFNKSRVLVLCGPPGSGKTSELERFHQKLEKNKSTGQTLLFYHASELGTGSNLAELTTSLVKWKESQDNGREIILIIDALDEALEREKTLLNQLIGLLKHQRLEKIRLVISCRSIVWEPEMGNTLSRMWGNEGKQIVFELCPLRWQDVQLAAGPDAEAFFDEISKNDAVPLARWPMTLHMLLDQFASTGTLAGTRREFYKNTIERLINEWDPQRKRRTHSLPKEVSGKEKAQMARRIAALLMFSGKSALALSEHSNDSSLLTCSDVLGSLPKETIDSGAAFDITQSKIEFLAQSNLFESFGTDHKTSCPVVKFAHRSFAELLAAEYVDKLPSTELQHLLCVPSVDGKEMVAPQMIQVAAWLASDPGNESFFDLLLRDHPEVLLQADLNLFSTNQKSTLVHRLIKIAENGNPGPSESISNASPSISFPGLSQILKTVILDSSRNHWVRQFALNLARKCQLSDLDHVLWEILERPNDEVRRDAGYTLTVIENNPGLWKEKLTQLAGGELGLDNDDTLKGIALRILVPRCIPVREILPYLTYPKEESFYGSYQGFLNHQLPSHLVPDDLPDSIKFLRSFRACFDSLSPFKEFADRVFEMACEHPDRPEIAVPLVEMWLEKARAFQPLPKDTDQSGFRAAFFSFTQAKAFISIALNHPETTCEDVGMLLGYSSHLDLGWLLNEFPKIQENRREIWAAAIRFHTTPESRAEHRELLQQCYEQYEEIRNRFPPIRKPGLDLHESMLRFEHAGELYLVRRRKQSGRKRELRTSGELTWQAVFEGGLEQCRNGLADGWIDVVTALQAKANSINFVSLDIDSAPLFLKLSNEDRSLVRETARNFLLKFKGNREKENLSARLSESAYYAIRWLRCDLRDDAKLQTAVKSKWIGAIIDVVNNAEDEHKEMVELAFSLNPKECRNWLKRLLERRLGDEGEGWFLDLNPFDRVWDSDFSKILIEILGSPSIKPQSMRDGLMFLAENDRPAAIDFAEAFLQRFQHSSASLQSPSDRAFLCTTLFTLHSEMWIQVWPLIATESSPVRLLFLENIRDYDRCGFEFLSSLDSNQIVDLYLSLIRLFPPSNDPPMSRESTFVTPEDECIQLRRDCAHELTRRGAIDQLHRILNHLPQDEGGIRWQIHEATQISNRGKWAPIACDDVLKLVRHSNAFLVRNGDDLMAVILSSLQRFQEDLQRQNISRFWDGDTPKREEVLSREISQWLGRDLKNMAVNREVVVNRLNQRVDLKVEAFPHDNSQGDPVTVIIEIKLADNKEIPDSIKDQLIEKYLNSDPGWNHGVYLVGWFKSKGRWEKRQYLKSKFPKGARSELRKYCNKASQQLGMKIASFVLDCSYPKKTCSKL